MFCQKCGNKITEGANFCQKCGAALHIEKVEHNVEETAKYDVVLTDVGQKKISAIQVICRHGGLTLVEAKELVDNFDRLKVLKKSITETEAKAIQVAFAEIGARVILKYCKRCGEALTEDRNHCGACGSAVAIVTPDMTLHLEKYSGSKTSSVVSKPLNSAIVYCPKCKSQKLQTVIESKTEGKGGGYGTGKGCLGWLLLGPLGLLCGICGSETKIMTTNKTLFMCMDCGNKFREANELAEEKSKTSVKSFIGGPVAIVLAIVFLLSKGAFLLGLFVIAIGCLAIWFGFDEQKASEEIKNKKYEAECYKKQKK